MAKTLIESSLTTRSARAKLAPGAHFRGIDPDVHLGYRKGRRGGVWFVRWRNGQGYRQRPLGVADDELSEGTLDYFAAVAAARKAVEKTRREARAAADGPVATVRSAVEAYVRARDKRENARRKRKDLRSDAHHRLARYVIGREKQGNRNGVPASPLADKPMHALEDTDLKAWREQLPDTLKATSRDRLINDLKAALYAAYAKHRKKLDPAVRENIQLGLKVEDDQADEDAPIARDNQILTDAQVTALIGAAGEIDAEQGWDGDLYRLIVVMAGTGARFSQIARLLVSDVQRPQSRISVPVSRKGRRTKPGPSHIGVAVGADVLNVLQPVLTGRRTGEILLERWRNKQVAGGKDGIVWKRDTRGPWQSPSEIVRPWAVIRERAGLPNVIPYALRHSSIVRNIRAGLPIRLVAARHDTSVVMIEQHYSKWIVDGLDDLAARAVVPLVPKSGKVVKLTGRPA